MKKITLAAMAVMVLVTGASASPIVDELLQLPICSTKTITSVGSFGEAKEETKEILDLFWKKEMTKEQSARLIAKVLKEGRLNKEIQITGQTFEEHLNWGYSMLSGTSIVAVMNVWKGRGAIPSEVKIKILNTSSKIGTQENSVDTTMIAQSIAGYLYPYRYGATNLESFDKEAIRRGALLRSFFTVISGKPYAGIGFDSCDGKRLEILNGNFFACYVAKDLIAPSKIRDEIVSKFLSKNDNEITSFMFSKPGVKEMYNNVMKEIEAK